MIEEDHCIYVNHSNASFIILFFYISDILLAENSKQHLNFIKEWLFLNFEMKGMEEAAFVINVKI